MTISETGAYIKAPREFGPELKPYTAIALQVGSPAIMKREEIKKIIIPHIRRCVNLAIPGASFSGYPVRLVCLPEAALQGWRAEFKLGNTKFCQDMAVEVPGEETDLLGDHICKKHNIYLIGTIKTLEPDIVKDRYFNTAFIINPEGKVILKQFKLNIANAERTTTPHDVWDKFVAKYGDGPDALFPVVDTDIGRLGCTICADGICPETYRGFAMQGVEVMSHPDFIVPDVSRWGVDRWALINRARAMDTGCYLICANGGPEYLRGYSDEPPFNQSGGRSMIVDYRGVILNEFDSCIEGFAADTIDVQRLREYRLNEINTWPSLAMLRTEYYRKLYEKPIYPKNLWVEKESTFPEMAKVIQESRQKLVEQGVWISPEAKGKEVKKKKGRV